MGLSQKFAASIAANIGYWQARLSDPSDADLRVIDLDRVNLYRAIEFGLGLQETWQNTARLIIQCYSLILQRGYYRDWIPVVEKVASFCTEDDLALKGRLLDQLGIFYRRNRQLDSAIAVHLEEEQIGELLEDASRIAFARMHLSAVYWRKHQYELAEQYGLDALDGFSTLGDNKEKVASCLINLGNIAQDRGDLVLAKDRLKRALELYRELNQLADVANALKNVSTVYETEGSYDKALIGLIEAADILAPTDFEIDKTMIEINIGTLYFRKGQLDLAEAAFKRADSPYMREFGPVFYRALTANNLGNVYLLREQWDQAEKYLQGSIILFRQARAQVNLANSLSGVAEALVGMGKVDEAIPYYDEAIEIVSEYPEDAWAQRLYTEFTDARAALVGDGAEITANRQI
ncbi:MAG: tetratricopeptide repeat protein [Candidatus Promineifilaceae bacterium]